MRIHVLIFSLSFVTFLPQLVAQNDSYVPDVKLTNDISYSSILVFGESSSKIAGGGVKFCNSKEFSKDTRFSIGPSVFMERSTFQKYLEAKNVKETHITILSPGINVKYKFNSCCFLQVDLTLIAGIETRVRIVPRASGRMEDDPRALSGLQLEETFFCRTFWKKKGLAGIGIYERIIDSDIYHSDFGAKAYLGLGW